MARLIPLACILLTICSCQPQSANANPVAIAKKVFDVGMEVYEAFKKIEEMLKAPETADEQMTVVDTKMLDKMDSISGAIQSFKTELFEKINEDLQDKLTQKTDKLFDIIRSVDRHYDQFLNFMKNGVHKYDRSTIKDFVKTLTTTRTYQFKDNLPAMHGVLIDHDFPKNESLLSILYDKENTQVMCIRNKSPQQLILDLFNTIVQTDTKGLFLLVFAYEQKVRLAGNGTFVQELIDAREFYKNRIEKTYGPVKAAMQKASRQIYKCDPMVYTKGKTYGKIQEVFQAYINDQSDTTTNRCLDHCESYQWAEPRCRTEFCKKQPKARMCNGHLRNCGRIHHSMKFCPSDAKSDRHYEWMETEVGNKHGRVGKCKNPVVTIKDYKPHPLALVYCEYCVCTCVSDSIEIDRYFSLLEVTSDTINNKVVTGVRLVNDNHVFHIQIQQGVLGPEGTIDPKTVSWKPIKSIPDIKQFSDYHFKESTSPDTYDYEEWVSFPKNKHVYPIKWDQKIVFLDDVEPQILKKNKNTDQVVTGLRFKQAGSELRLEVETIPFDYATGQLLGRSEWFWNHKRIQARTQVSMSEADVPINRRDHRMTSMARQYVEFQTTDLKKDFGQYVVPFLDMQSVETSPPMPLAGAGLYHKGAEGSGGFLSLKLIHYDFTKHLSNSFA